MRPGAVVPRPPRHISATVCAPQGAFRFSDRLPVICHESGEAVVLNRGLGASRLTTDRMVVLVGARKSASTSAASGRAHRTLCEVATGARQSPSRKGREQPRAPYLNKRKKVARQRGNGIPDSMPLGSGNLDVQLGRQRLPLPGQNAKRAMRHVTRLGKA